MQDINQNSLQKTEVNTSNIAPNISYAQQPVQSYPNSSQYNTFVSDPPNRPIYYAFPVDKNNVPIREYAYKSESEQNQYSYPYPNTYTRNVYPQTINYHQQVPTTFSSVPQNYVYQQPTNQASITTNPNPEVPRVPFSSNNQFSFAQFDANYYRPPQVQSQPPMQSHEQNFYSQTQSQMNLSNQMIPQPPQHNQSQVLPNILSQSTQSIQPQIQHQIHRQPLPQPMHSQPPQQAFNSQQPQLMHPSNLPQIHPQHSFSQPAQMLPHSSQHMVPQSAQKFQSHYRILPTPQNLKGPPQHQGPSMSSYPLQQQSQSKVLATHQNQIQMHPNQAQIQMHPNQTQLQMHPNQTQLQMHPNQAQLQMHLSQTQPQMHPSQTQQPMFSSQTQLSMHPSQIQPSMHPGQDQSSPYPNQSQPSIPLVPSSQHPIPNQSQQDQFRLPHSNASGTFVGYSYPAKYPYISQPINPYEQATYERLLNQQDVLNRRRSPQVTSGQPPVSHDYNTTIFSTTNIPMQIKNRSTANTPDSIIKQNIPLPVYSNVSNYNEQQDIQGNPSNNITQVEPSKSPILDKSKITKNTLNQMDGFSEITKIIKSDFNPSNLKNTVTKMSDEDKERIYKLVNAFIPNLDNYIQSQDETGRGINSYKLPPQIFEMNIQDKTDELNLLIKDFQNSSSNIINDLNKLYELINIIVQNNQEPTDPNPNPTEFVE